MTSPDRFPDLSGKAVINIGESSSLTAITEHLAAHRMLIAVVSAERELVRESIEVAEGFGAVVNGFTVDPADPAVWERIRPHIEQRLGPIDVAIVAGTDRVRAATVAALLPDMSARKRGVIIEIGAGAPAEPTSGGVRRYAIDGDLADADMAAVVVRYASDTAAP